MRVEILHSEKQNNIIKTNKPQDKCAVAITADTLKQAFNNVFSLLRQVDRRDLKHKHLIIVPENLSFTAEKGILENVGDSLFNIQALSFSRLLYRISNIVNNKRFLSKNGGIMLIAKIMIENGDKLTFFSKNNIFSFAEEIYNIILQFKTCSIMPEDIVALKESDYKNLAVKLKEIEFIYRLYEEFLSNNFYDNVNKLEYLASEINNSSYLNNATVYILGFNNFSRSDLSIISEILKKATKVVFSFVFDRNSSQYLDEGVKAIEMLCDRLNIGLKKVNKPDQLTNVQKQIKDYMFTYKKIKSKLPLTDEINIYKADDVFSECTYAANRINYLVKGLGYRYKDIALICEDFKKYSIAVESVFNAYNIPFFHDGGSSLINHEAAKYLLLLLKIKTTKCSKNDYIALSKNIFSNFCAKQVMDFENYCIKYLKQYYNFAKEFSFYKGEDGELLKNAESIRVKLVSLLESFNIPQVASAEGFLNAITSALNASDFKNRLSDFTNNLQEKSLSDYSAQVYQAIEKTLTTLSNIFGNFKISAETYFEIVRVGFSSCNISIIPSYIDNVFCSNIYDAKIIDKKAIIIIGANEGIMPLVMRDNKVFTDNDLNLIKEAGLDVSPTIDMVNKRSIFSLFLVLLSFQDKLYLTYSKGGDDMNTSRPSRVVRHMQEMFSGNIFSHTTESKNIFFNAQSFSDSSEFLYSVGNLKNAYLLYAKGIRLIADGFNINRNIYSMLYNILQNSPYKESVDKLQFTVQKLDNKYSIDSASQLYFVNGTTSVSELESYFACPFKHFAKYGLLLSEREEYQIKNTDVGTYLHYIVEQFSKSCKNLSYDRAASDKLVENIINQTLNKKEYEYLTFDAQKSNVFKRLEIEAKRACFSILAFTKSSNFEIIDTEKAFFKTPEVVLNCNGIDISFSGKVDRLDECGDNFLVVDYKSGQASASFSELYYGEKIQLFVYMLAMSTDEKKPVGVYYFPINDNFSEGGNNEILKMQGIQIDDAAILSQIDTTLSADKLKSDFLPLEIEEKDGKLKYKAVAGLQLINKEYFEKSKEYVKMVSSLAASEILSGNISVAPCANACTYCQYKRICKYDAELIDSERQLGGRIDEIKIAEVVDKCKKSQTT